MLVDAGGYTVDITINEILDDNYKLSQLSPPSGGPWGSTVINNDIENIFIQYFGKEYIDEVKKKEKAWIEILNKIEEYKIDCDKLDSDKIDPNDNSNFDFIFNPRESLLDKSKIPKGIFTSKDITLDLPDEKGDKVKFNVSYKENHLYIKKKDILKIMTLRIRPIISQIQFLLNKFKNYNISLIVLSGGFGCSKILKSELEKIKFKNKKNNYIIPLCVVYDPELAVVRGAVRFGFNPNIITSRISPLTYFTITHLPWSDSYKTSASKVNIEGESYARIAHIFFHKDEKITEKNKNKKLICYPILNNQTKVISKLFSSDTKDIDISQPLGIKLLGFLNVDVTNNEQLPLNEREVELTLNFSSCIWFSAKNVRTNQSFETVFYYGQDVKFKEQENYIKMISDEKGDEFLKLKESNIQLIKEFNGNNEQNDKKKDVKEGNTKEKKKSTKK